MSDLARAVAEAGTATRDRKIEEALDLFHASVAYLDGAVPAQADDATFDHVEAARLEFGLVGECLDKLARLIAQRDGYAAAQSIGPYVALPVGGQGR